MSYKNKYPKSDKIKTKKTNRSQIGTVQDIGWQIAKDEPEDCSRHQVYDLNRVQGEHEH